MRVPPIEELKETIELFLLEHSRPMLTEPGSEVIDLSISSYSLSMQHDKLLWHVWNENTNLVRQITGIHKQSAGRIEMRYQRFGKGPPGTLVLADSRARPDQLDRRSRRTQFLHEMRRWLNQLFPQWKIEELTTEPDLARSFSGRYARGLISRGMQAWAVIGSGVQEDASAADDTLGFGIIWLDWLRHRHKSKVIEGLKIFLPADRVETTLARLAWMNAAVAKWELYETSYIGGEELRKHDPADFGNLKTSLPPLPRATLPPQSDPGWSSRIASLSPEIETRSGPGGFVSWSLHGLVFARQTPKGIVFGLGRAETPCEEDTEKLLRRLVEQIARHRRAHPPDANHPLYRIQPERWMQSMVGGQLASLGHGLAEGPVYEQVPAVSGTARGLLDLLTVDAQGRLVVIELKASEDLQLPLQALDYWMRVHWHHQRGEVGRGGYFSGRPLNPQPPLLLLVSPALQFHAASEIILRYFSPEVEVIRVGLNENWREGLQVVFRDGGRSQGR
jgi:hypothetical protein